MTLLDRHFGTHLIGTLLKAMVSLVLMFILIDLLTHRRTEIMNHDVPWQTVVKYYAVFVPQILYKYQVAALATLVSALLVLGNAAQNNEITASLAAGISLRRLMRFPILMALGVAVVVFALQETVGVAGTREADRIEEQYFARTKFVPVSGISWPNLENGWTCHILKFNRIALTGERVLLLAIREKTIEQIQARRIFWDETRAEWLLEDGYWHVFNAERGFERQTKVIRQQPAPFSSSPAELFALEQSPDTKNVLQLAGDIRRAEARGVPTAHQRVDLHAKFAQPALAFVMIWLAIPFALRVRRGGLAIGFGVSIAIALSYLMLFRLSMGLGYIGHLSPMVAAWLANGAFLITGMVLFRRTAS